MDMLQIYVAPGLHMHRDNFDEIYFQQDGAPPHYAVHIHEFMDNTFGGRIGRRGLTDMPPRSPHLTPMDFYFWGVVKDMCTTKTKTLGDLKSITRDSFEKIHNDPQCCKTVCSSVPKRLQQCYQFRR
jgi:hypothetical protein